VAHLDGVAQRGVSGQTIPAFAEHLEAAAPTGLILRCCYGHDFLVHLRLPRQSRNRVFFIFFLDGFDFRAATPAFSSGL